MNDFLAGLRGILGQKELLARSLRVVLILGLTLVALTAVRRALLRLERRVLAQKLAEGREATEESKRAQTLMRLLRQAAAIFIWGLAGLVILQEFQVQIGAILASAGILGVVVGFGAQNLVRDLIAGFFLVFENQVRVGDVAVVNGTRGLVERINLRKMVLRDVAGVVHIFPNGAITTLANMTYQWSAYVLEVGIDYKEDIDRVIEVMRQVGTELRADPQFGPHMLEEIEIFGVDGFAGSAFIIKGRLKTKPIHQWAVGREYRRRLKLAFEAHGIAIAKG
ncbi:MAG: mechanosensitive ion channel family protein [Desulfobacteraceae bacterium]|nr:mechanosensitive ion channel family protein [Desulfobacteraceae bacterium]